MYVWAMTTSTLALSAGLNALGFRPALPGTDGVRFLRLRLLRAPDGLRSVQGRHRAHIASLNTTPDRATGRGFFLVRCVKPSGLQGEPCVPKIPQDGRGKPCRFQSLEP